MITVCWHSMVIFNSVAESVGEGRAHCDRRSVGRGTKLIVMELAFVELD